MKFKKIILVFLIPFLLTGCASVNYNLDINKDLTVTEKVFISATSDYFSSFYKNYPKTIVLEWYDTDKKDLLNKNNYTHELVTKNVTYPGVLVQKQYNSLAEYTNNTIFKEQSFENIVSITNDNLVTIKTTNFLPYVEDQTDVRYSISALRINIKVPYVVVSDNADDYDPKTNTYSWNINADTSDKEINLTFDKDRIYVYNLIMYISIIVLCFIVLVLIFVIRRIIKKNKLNNRIVIGEIK